MLLYFVRGYVILKVQMKPPGDSENEDKTRNRLLEMACKFNLESIFLIVCK